MSVFDCSPPQNHALTDFITMEDNKTEPVTESDSPLRSWGECQHMQYIGCIGIKNSMRSLCHRMRSEVAKESINRLCEAIKIKRNTDRKRSDISRMLEDEPNLLHSGMDVKLDITTTHLNVISRETQQIIVQHEMPNVSFASIGDEDTVDYVAYVAKNEQFGRSCFVLECGYVTAKSVLETIGRGFNLRSQQVFNNSTLPKYTMNHERFSIFNGTTMHLTEAHDTLFEPSYRINNENQRNESITAATRASLEKEPWFHGSYLSREESETRLKNNGDFLVRESLLDPGNFVLSVMNQDTKLHLLFDSIMGKVRTRDMEFKDISHLVKYHHDEGSPLVADNRVVYLSNGVRPTSRS